MNYLICLEDALDHSTTLGEFDNLEEAQAFYKECQEDGPSGYDIGLELASIDEDEEWETLDYTEWFTQESWEAAHPSGFPD